MTKDFGQTYCRHRYRLFKHLYIIKLDDFRAKNRRCNHHMWKNTRAYSYLREIYFKYIVSSKMHFKNYTLTKCIQKLYMLGFLQNVFNLNFYARSEIWKHNCDYLSNSARQRHIKDPVSKWKSTARVPAVHKKSWAKTTVRAARYRQNTSVAITLLHIVTTIPSESIMWHE